MALHYNKNTDAALVRVVLEQEGLKGYKLGMALSLILKLVAELHAAGGTKAIDYATYAYGFGYSNNDAFGEHVNLAAKLGYLNPPRRQTVNEQGYATIGVILELGLRGHELVATVSTSKGTEEGSQLISENRERMLRKARRKHTPAQTSNVVISDVKRQQNGNKTAPERNSSQTSPSGFADLAQQKCKSSPSENADLAQSLVVPKETYRDQERDIREIKPLSPSQGDGQCDRGVLEKVLKSAAFRAVWQQERLGKTDGEGITPESIETYVRLAEPLGYEETIWRLCNCFAWAASQHWFHGRPYSKQFAPSIARHLQGEYPEPPDADNDSFKGHAEHVCQVAYNEKTNHFAIYDCTGRRVGYVGYWNGDVAGDVSEAPVDTSDDISTPVNAVPPAPTTHTEPLTSHHRGETRWSEGKTVIANAA